MSVSSAPAKSTAPFAAQLIEKKVSPKAAEMTREMVKRYQKEFGDGPIAPHVSMGFNNLWILLNDVLPRAIQKHGGFSPDQLAKAVVERDWVTAGASGLPIATTAPTGTSPAIAASAASSSARRIGGGKGKPCPERARRVIAWRG